jgi:inhibitor of KinA
VTIEYSIRVVNERSIALILGDSIDEQTHARVFSIYKYLLKNRQPEWQDVIPAYTTITIIIDVARLIKKISSPIHFVKEQLCILLESFVPEPSVSSRKLKIPVCYHPSLGIDLHRLSSESDNSVNSIVELHTAIEYTVFMLGFLPGFAYMGSVDDRIAFPRLKQPRTLVRAGSVGIAGKQTGIYPMESPGGWNIVGVTPVPLFTKENDSPTLFNPSDRVTFYPISLAEFELFDTRSFNPLVE